MENKRLEDLIHASRRVRMSPGQREEQRRSFVYGNISIENHRVTREVVNEAADRLSTGEH